MIEWLVRKRIFRNSNHAIWFLASISIFILVVVHYLLPFNKWLLLIVPAVVHVSPFVNSVVRKVKNIPSEIYSVACIWFNGVMIGVYFIFWILI